MNKIVDSNHKGQSPKGCFFLMLFAILMFLLNPLSSAVRGSGNLDFDAGKDSNLEMKLEPTKVTMYEDLVLKKRLTMSTISCNVDKALGDASHVYVDTSDGDVTLTLPEATSGLSYTIKKTTHEHDVFILPNDVFSSTNIEKKSLLKMSSTGENGDLPFVVLNCDGNDWFILSKTGISLEHISMANYEHMVIKIDTEANDNNPGEKTFELPLRYSDTRYTVNIDWGDGDASEYAGTGDNVSKTYSSPDQYYITIKFDKEANDISFPGVQFTKGASLNNPVNPAKLIEIVAWGQDNYNNMKAAFYGCKNMTINEDAGILKTNDPVNFESAFRECSSLNAIPGLETSSALTFSHAFRDCTALTELSHLDTSSTTNFSYAFYGCSSLNELPLLDTSNATNFSYAFYGCSSLNELPLLDTSNVTNFSYAWNSCSNLTEIPLLDTSSAINIEGAWAKTNIKDIPTFNFKEVTNGKFAFNASPVSNDSYNKFLKNLADIFDDLQGTSSTRIKFGANTASASGDGKIARNTLLQKWDILDNTTL